MLSSLKHRAKRAFRRYFDRRDPAPTVWYHTDFRVPIEGIGLETRRADFVIWTLLDLGVIDSASVGSPQRASYSQLARIHTYDLLEVLSDASQLAPIFGASPTELPMENVARTIRLGAGATIQAAKRAAAGAGPQINLLGGFHHASPDRGGGFSVVNDIAVAIAELREDGFDGRVAVLDLDAHPPDGTADCVAAHPWLGDVWIGSISGADWGPLPGVDETVIVDADDSTYRSVLDGLLSRMPPCELAFVVAGGDVLDGDRFGGLSLSLEGAHARHKRVASRLGGTPAVWLSAGGYSDDAWRILLDIVAVLALHTRLELPPGYDPLRARMSRVARELTPPLGDDDWLTMSDLALDLGFRPEGSLRLLNVYTPEWLEHAFQRYGLLDHIARLGYSDFRVEVDRSSDGDRMRMYGSGRGAEHRLFETVVDEKKHGDERFLFVNWLTLRHPLAAFTEARPKLPNQEVPGLGLAREAGELLALAAQRLGYAGVMIHPAAFHVAYTARYDFSFVDPARQGRFEKLIEDLAEELPLAELTQHIDAGRVTLDGEPYQWEATPMVVRLDGQRTKAEPCDGRFEVEASQ